MFYTFIQNNSGGSFDSNEKRGIAPKVIIEAASQSEAMERAEGIGLYFDGVDAGTDCPCCGDRWYSPDSGTDAPMIYGSPATEYGNGRLAIFWVGKGKEICIHHADGRKEWF